MTDFSFNYPNSPYLIQTGNVVDISNTIISGSASGATFRISPSSPSLPYQLSINNLNGTISGIPTYISILPLTVFTVDASFSATLISTQFSMSINVAPNFTYLGGPFIISINNVVTIVPTYLYANLQGVIYSLVSMPALSDINLTLNTNSGIIMGTPLSTLASTTYTIRANNGGILFDASLNISVLTLPTIAYHDKNYILTQGYHVHIFPLFLSLQPNVVYTLNCELPIGLEFDTATGQIKGVPTVLSPYRQHTVTITNIIGSASTQFTMTVIKVFLAPPAVSESFISGLCLTEPTLEMRRKAEILKYKKNSSCLTKRQQFSLAVQGNGPYGKRSWANQNVTVTNPNISGLPQQGYSIICNSPAILCAPTSSSDVPGSIINLCYDPTVPLVGYVQPNRKKVDIGFKWPQQTGNTAAQLLQLQQPIIPIYIPSAPTILYATVTDIGASIYFTPPLDDGGSAIVNYLYAIDGGITFTLLNPAQITSPITIIGLISGRTYGIVLAAFDAFGASGLMSDMIKVTIGQFIPEAPTIVSTTVSDKAALINFLPPANNGGCIINNYKYSINGGATFTAINPPTVASPLSITGLSNGTVYSVVIKAVNVIGDGIASNTVTITPMTFPSIPTIQTVVAGDNMIFINFNAPSNNGGSTIINYNYSVDGGGTFTSAGQIFSPINVIGLINGQLYYVVLQAVNSVGLSQSSSPAVTVVPIAVPRAPTNLSSSVGDRAATISFTAPDNGGSPITNYQYSLDGGTMFLNALQTTSPIYISGLTNGTTYNVILRAVSAIGAGTVSAPIAVIPMTIPSAPIIQYDTVTESSATLHFIQTNTSGSTIIFYNYSINGGVTFLLASQTESPITITGLVDGTTYPIRLQAVNSIGVGIPSTTINVLAGQIGPDAPTNLYSTIGDASANIFFNAPINNGKSIITNYYYYLGDVSYNTVPPMSVSSPITIAGLTNGQTYLVRLQAVNSDAAGTKSSSISVTPMTTPSAPTNLSTVGLNGAIDISFNSPLSNGGSPITDYKYSLDGGVTFTSTGQLTSPIYVAGLVNGFTYQVELKAVNVMGDGAATAPAIAVTPYTIPNPPFIYYSIVSDTSANIYFAQSNDGGNAIHQYNYYMHDMSNNTDVSLNTMTVTSPITITGLTKNHMYSLYLQAVNTASTSVYSNNNIFVAGQIEPSAPIIISCVTNDVPRYAYSGGFNTASASINFISPMCHGNGPITNYVYWINATPYTVSTLISPIKTITLRASIYPPGSDVPIIYSIKLQAVNASATGVLSNIISYNGAILPTAPTNLMSISRDSALDISFSQYNGSGSPIINYNYSLNNINVTLIPFNPPQTISPVRISGLINGQNYPVQLQAVNAVGAGGASLRDWSSIPMTTPSAPVIVSAGIGKNSALDISFNVPNNGGSAITNYYYYLQDIDISYNAVGVTSPITISGLTNGTLYYIKLQAVNSVGPGIKSLDISAIPMTLPPPPNNLTAIVLSDVATDISFSQINTSGSQISNYSYSFNNGLTFTPFDPSQNSSPVGLTGLVRGQTYTVELQSKNYLGYSIDSSSVTFTTWTLPSLPQITHAIGIDGGVQIYFTLLQGDGGTPIISYNYYVNSIQRNTLQTSETMITIYDLSNGTPYHIAIQAINLVGAGPISDTFYPAIPMTVPSAPQILSYAMTDGGVDISFNQANTGGSPISDYYYSIDGTNYYVAYPYHAQTTSPVIITGLTNNIIYTVRLKAKNSAGFSFASNPITFTYLLSGTLDMDFTASNGNGFYWVQPTDYAQVYCTSIQPNGAIIVGGAFQHFNGHVCNGIARLLLDGNFDATFNTGSGVEFGVLCNAIQPDSNIIIGGAFQSYNGAPCNYIARVSILGVFDSAFNTGIGAGFNKQVYCVTLQPSDGKIVLGGAFTTFNDVSCNSIARLNTNGTLDTGFNAGFNAGFNDFVYSLALQAVDGKIIAGGAFTTYNDLSCNSIVRLNVDGTIDPIFSAGIGTGFNALVNCLAIQSSDSKIIIGGAFTAFDGFLCNSLVRLNVDGTLDLSFNTAVGSGFNGALSCCSVQLDGKIIVGGAFTRFNDSQVCNSIARLNPDGTLDTSFNIRSGFISGKTAVKSIAQPSNGNIIVGGDFNYYNKIACNSIARLYI